MTNEGCQATPGYAGPVEQRLTDLEGRVARLEAANSRPRPAEPGPPAGLGTGAGPRTGGPGTAEPGTGGPAIGSDAAGGTGGDPEAAADGWAGPASSPGPGPTAGEQAGRGRELESDVFWALHGLQDRVGQRGAVLFTGTVALPGGAYYEWQEGRLAGDLLDADWSESATGLTALGHPVRLLLLREVLHGAQTAAQLSAHPRLGTSGQLYHHLRLLVSAGWLRSSARGQYDVPADRVVPLLTILAATR